MSPSLRLTDIRRSYFEVPLWGTKWANKAQMFCLVLKKRPINSEAPWKRTHQELQNQEPPLTYQYGISKIPLDSFWIPSLREQRLSGDGPMVSSFQMVPQACSYICSLQTEILHNNCIAEFNRDIPQDIPPSTQKWSPLCTAPLHKFIISAVI